MKKTVLSLVALFLMGTASVFAQSKTDEFKVYGNCGMCEDRIETAAKSVDGVTTADWNKETGMLALTYDESKTSTADAQKAIAKSGHDTDVAKADSKVYNELPGCCKYDRPSAKSTSKSDCKTDCKSKCGDKK